jgi:serine phosphatase RsbU (regulator of sigma subunit)
MTRTALNQPEGVSPPREPARPPDAQANCNATAAEAAVNVLLVDDEPANLVTLEAVLEGLNLNLVKAHSGREALRCLLRHDFALILMDVRMPGMDGFETAELIRQRDRSRYTPIIFLTAVETGDLGRFKGYALGAVDYLAKPIVPAVLRAKAVVFVELFRKTEQVKRQAEQLRQLEQREHQRQLAEAHERWLAERLREELRVARKVQQRLFPAAPPPVAGLDISGTSTPADAMGGDYFDYIPMADGALGVVIGDVSGHGLGPALLMAEMRAYLRALLLTHGDVGAAVTLLNRALAADTDDRFATLLLARFDPGGRSFTYVSAGHMTGYVLDPSGAVRLPLPATQMPLGVLPDTAFDAGPPLTLEPGELVLLVTDGLVEAHTAEQVLFGSERLLEFVQAHHRRSAREILEALFAAVPAFCGSAGPGDDMTAIVVKVLAAP